MSERNKQPVKFSKAEEFWMGSMGLCWAFGVLAALSIPVCEKVALGLGGVAAASFVVSLGVLTVDAVQKACRGGRTRE